MSKYKKGYNPLRGEVRRHYVDHSITIQLTVFEVSFDL